MVDGDTKERIRRLAVPPAWRDVWICPWPNGHIQAIGIDAAGRRQYRYHEAWHQARGQQKFARVLDFARVLPEVRRTVARDLDASHLSRNCVAATAVRLLDVGCFRVGGEAYAEEHKTFGVATLQKRHVRCAGGILAFDYPAKGSLRRIVSVQDAEAYEVVRSLRRRRSGGDELFVYRRGREWTNLRSDDVNAYIKAAAGDDYSAKDFRTWSATVLAAALLGAEAVPHSETGRRRGIVRAIKGVAEQLGNTPAVCRSSYVDPRVLDRYRTGETIRNYVDERFFDDVTDIGMVSTRRLVERAVIELIDGESASRVAA